MFNRTVFLYVILHALVALGFLSVPSVAQGQELRLGRDLFIGGGSVAVSNQVAGDALLAGGRVTLSAPVGGDAAMAGGEVEVSGPIAQDLYAAGGQLRINGTVTGSARLAGGAIRLSQGARVEDGLSAAGGRIELAGMIGSYANLAGGSITIDGTVSGNVEATGGTLRVGPRAIIQGQLTYRGPQAADVAAGAQISGGVRNIAYEPPMYRRSLPLFFGIIALIWLIGWGIVGALLLWILPVETRRVTLAAQANPGFAALIGVIALIVTPIAIMLLLISAVGLPLAFLLGLLYLVLLAGVIALGDWFLPRLRRQQDHATAGARIGAFILVLIVVFILTQFPFIGWLGGLFLWVIGIGAILLALTRRNRAAGTVMET
jgi:hypothetical protein